MSSTFTVEAVGLDAALAKLNALATRNLKREALEQVGGRIESQTRRRLGQEKRAPDGAPWAPWSPFYAASGEARSMLQRDGGLIDSLAYFVDGEELSVGSNLVYAAVHQFGGTIRGKAGKLAFKSGDRTVIVDHVDIPARPYLGLSEANIAEINASLDDWLGSILQ